MLSPDELANLPSAKSGLRTLMDGLRSGIKKISIDVHEAKEDQRVQAIESPGSRGEALANLTLAYRHLEDARMRLGKVLEAADGMSILDR